MEMSVAEEAERGHHLPGVFGCRPVKDLFGFGGQALVR
jgi:hypothetical protein